MTHFLDKIQAELKSNSKLNKNPLINILTESVDKSIALGENKHTIYLKLKNGLYSINEQSTIPELKILLDQIERSESTIDSKVSQIANSVGLKKHIKILKESISYTNPIIKSEIDLFESSLDSGKPEFYACVELAQILEKYKHDATFNSVLTSIHKYISSNESKLHMLYTIYEMDSLRSPVYSEVSATLKELLLNEQYSADILKLRFGNSIPLINNLISNLRITESKKNNAFTLGEGNGDTVVDNLIAPMVSTKDGMLIYLDNRFLSIRESKSLLGSESKIHINSKYKISEINPLYVRENLSDFYSICEAYANLGFEKSRDGLGVESKSLRNIKLGLKLNENRELDMYINGIKPETTDLAKLQIAQATALQTTQNKIFINKILENSSKIFNFEFIKSVTNHRLGKEILITKLDNDYYVCEKKNQVEHEWSKKTPNQLYSYILENFKYDIRPIFGEKISESEKKINTIESRKKQILVEVEKLEESVNKLKVAISIEDIELTKAKKLESIKESIEHMINSLKEEYVTLDLAKAEL